MRRVTLEEMHRLLVLDALNGLAEQQPTLLARAHRLGDKIRRQCGLNRPNDQDRSLLALALFRYELEHDPIAAQGVDLVAARLHIMRRLEAHYRDFIRKHSRGGGVLNDQVISA